MNALAGQHAFVTGGGTGIGAAIARRLVRDGARVTLVGRRAGPLVQVAGEIRAATAVCDVTDPDQIAAALNTARSVHGPVTILINNAGAAEAMPFRKLDLTGWRRMTGINLDALFLVAQAALSDLLAAPAGRVVTIASTAGLRGYAYTTAYCASKHGAIGLTRSLALELAGTAVTVNAVCPGFTETELVARSVEGIVAKTGRSADEARDDLVRFNPQGRLVTPDQVADSVAWLCRPDSQAITGQAIAVAGGEVM